MRDTGASSGVDAHPFHWADAIHGRFHGIPGGLGRAKSWPTRSTSSIYLICSIYFNLLLSFASKHPILQHLANMVGRPQAGQAMSAPCVVRCWNSATFGERDVPWAACVFSSFGSAFLWPSVLWPVLCVGILAEWAALLCQPAPSAVLLQLFMKETADTRQTMGINCGIAVIESWERGREGEVYNRNRVCGSTTCHILCKSICICNHMYTICGLEYMYTCTLYVYYVYSILYI